MKKEPRTTTTFLVVSLLLSPTQAAALGTITARLCLCLMSDDPPASAAPAASSRPPVAATTGAETVNAETRLGQAKPLERMRSPVRTEPSEEMLRAVNQLQQHADLKDPQPDPNTFTTTIDGTGWE